MESFRGSCLCQTVKYEGKGEIKGFYLCHCSHCRKVSGSAHAANLFVALEEMVWLSGEDSVSTYNLPNTRFSRAFCPNCSSALPHARSKGFVVIPAGSLDSELKAVPNAHISCDSRAAWDHQLELVPQVAGLPQ